MLSQHHCTVSATILAHNRIEGLDSFDTQADLDRLSYKGNVLPLGVKKKLWLLKQSQGAVICAVW